MVAIDGPSGSGKSTVARLTARELGYRYLDTGAMYRAATLISMREGAGIEREADLVAAVRKHRIEVFDDEKGTKVLIDGKDVSEDIRTPELTRRIGPICEIPGVRKLLGELQRQMGEEGGVVLEGRDIGTVIFPDAEVKIYLTASSEERALRRWKELKSKGVNIELDRVLKDIEARDQRDRERDLAPLRKAGDAVEIDTTGMSLEEVVAAVAVEVRKRFKGEAD